MSSKGSVISFIFNQFCQETKQQVFWCFPIIDYGFFPLKSQVEWILIESILIAKLSLITLLSQLESLIQIELGLICTGFMIYKCRNLWFELQAPGLRRMAKEITTDLKTYMQLGQGKGSLYRRKEYVLHNVLFMVHYIKKPLSLLKAEIWPTCQKCYLIYFKGEHLLHGYSFLKVLIDKSTKSADF